MTASHSPNPPEELKQKLQALVPEAFKDGKLDVEILKRSLGSETELRDESYVLNWLGKSYARLLANENTRTWLKGDDEHNSQPENANSQNLLIKGDNLEVLKHLVGAYEEKIKMIYIDPPYNTGGDGFVYADDRKFTVEQLSQLAGIDEDEAKRILEFTQAKSNSHSAWLTFMYPRLYIAKQLLRDDGVIFISIDDNEQAQLKLLCDEVFGEVNFVAEFIWKSKSGGANDSRFVAVDHEYVISYGKNIDHLTINQDKHATVTTSYNQRDELGEYALDRLDKQSIRYSKSLDYEITDSDGRVYKPAHKDPKKPNASWRWGKKTVQERYSELVFKDGFVYTKNYKKDGAIPRSLLIEERFGRTRTGKTDLAELIEQAPFDNPKPTKLIEYFCRIATCTDSLVLDFFAGSGTTGHAVMNVNLKDKDSRRHFICVQLPEEANKSGYESIFDITKARIEKAAAKIKAENPECQGDFGFKIFGTAPIPDNYQDAPEDLTENLELFDANKLTQTDSQSLMRTWALQDNVPLTLDLVPVDLAGYTAYQAKHILYFIEPNISLDAVIKLLEQLDNNPDFKPSRLVVFGYLLESKIQREMTEAVKHYNNRKGIELTLDVRY